MIISMRHLHRLVATLLLVFFVPATVMAGPLRLCLGQDGHRMVEFVHDDHHTLAGPQADHSAAPLSELVSASGSDGGCVDLALVAMATAAQAKTDHDHVPPGGEMDASPGLVAEVTLTVDPTFARPAHAYSVRRDPADGGLAALRTVILLI